MEFDAARRAALIPALSHWASVSTHRKMTANGIPPSPLRGGGSGGGASEEWRPTPILAFPHQGRRNRLLCRIQVVWIPMVGRPATTMRVATTVAPGRGCPVTE